MPGKAPGGIVATIILGIVGPVVGAFLGTLLGFGNISGFDLRGMAFVVGDCWGRRKPTTAESEAATRFS